MRTLLAPLRAALLLVHIVAGIAITALAFPLLAQPQRNRIIRAWSQALLLICGARLRLEGLPLPPSIARTGVEHGSRGRMLLANHVSWIDVFAIHASVPSCFVAKAEIRDWPLLGTLVTRVGTLYIERGRRQAVASMNRRVGERLLRGETVAVFPEGTTTDGRSLLPFHSNLVAPAKEAGAECWPVALRYSERGEHSSAAAFVGDIGLLASLWRILVARRLQIEVAFLEPVPTAGERDRHHIAEAAAERIAAWLDLPVPAGRRLTPARNRGGDKADSEPGAGDGTASPAP
jgi:1-acyl-sn-glycerol-3-phosphate acyltransferase